MKLAYVLPARLELEIERERKLSEDPDLPFWAKNRAMRRIQQLEWRLRSERRYVLVNRWAKISMGPVFVVCMVVWRGFSDPKIPFFTRLSDWYPVALFLLLGFIYGFFLQIWRFRMTLLCPHDDDKEIAPTGAKTR